LCHEFATDVLDRLLGSVDKHDLKQNIVVVNFGYGLSVNGIGVPSQLVNFLVEVVFNFGQEVLVFLGGTRRNLFCLVEITRLVFRS
jgi:hypothetical protein